MIANPIMNATTGLAPCGELRSLVAVEDSAAACRLVGVGSSEVTIEDDWAISGNVSEDQ